MKCAKMADKKKPSKTEKKKGYAKGGIVKKAGCK
jgi:hypothetical protein